jgi:hypothetical protein
MITTTDQSQQLPLVFLHRAYALQFFELAECVGADGWAEAQIGVVGKTRQEMTPRLRSSWKNH